MELPIPQGLGGEEVRRSQALVGQELGCHHVGCEVTLRLPWAVWTGGFCLLGNQ
jgi:hypothetical protein